MSVPIVVDEWLLEDLMGSDLKKQKQAIDFIWKVVEICDTIVILEDSPFQKKIWNMMKGSRNGSVTLRVASQAFEGLIRSNKDKVYPLAQGDIKSLPTHLIPLINSAKDHYLFQSYLKLKNKGSFILTTDGRWNHDGLRKTGIEIKMRDQFVPGYLSRQLP